MQTFNDKIEITKGVPQDRAFQGGLSAANRHMFEGSSTRYRYTVKATYMGIMRMLVRALHHSGNIARLLPRYMYRIINPLPQTHLRGQERGMRHTGSRNAGPSLVH